ncbi:MAG TPA: hypothetical protein EYP04_12575 [Anaerolineae bacterium]|nr:hypothetical protein [Anaerolineae bacterium]HIQ05179.1 hypothetical protein [Anaerolineae bacterium]
MKTHLLPVVEEREKPVETISRMPYEPPCILYDAQFDVSAGSPLGLPPDPVDPTDPRNLGP